MDNKEREDFRNARNICSFLAYEREREFKIENGSFGRLYKNLDSIEFMHSNANDRIRFAMKSGLIPNPEKV